MFWDWNWKLHIFQGVKMSSTWFCMVGPWHSVTGVQIFRRKWKLLHWRGSDVIPLYRPTAREIKLSHQFWNLQILPNFFFANWEMGAVNDSIWLLSYFDFLWRQICERENTYCSEYFTKNVEAILFQPHLWVAYQRYGLGDEWWRGGDVKRLSGM